MHSLEPVTKLIDQNASSLGLRLSYPHKFMLNSWEGSWWLEGYHFIWLEMTIEWI